MNGFACGMISRKTPSLYLSGKTCTKTSSLTTLIPLVMALLTWKSSPLCSQAMGFLPRNVVKPTISSLPTKPLKWTVPFSPSCGKNSSLLKILMLLATSSLARPVSNNHSALNKPMT